MHDKPYSQSVVQSADFYSVLPYKVSVSRDCMFTFASHGLNAQPKKRHCACMPCFYAYLATVPILPVFYRIKWRLREIAYFPVFYRSNRNTGVKIDPKMDPQIAPKSP